MISEFKKVFTDYVNDGRFNVALHIIASEDAGVPRTQSVDLSISYPKCGGMSGFAETQEKIAENTGRIADALEYDFGDDVDTGEEDFVECTGEAPGMNQLKSMISDAIKSFGGDASENGADVKVEEIPGGVCVSFRKIEEDDEPKCCGKKCCGKKKQCDESDEFSSMAKMFNQFIDASKDHVSKLDWEALNKIRDKFENI